MEIIQMKKIKTSIYKLSNLGNTLLSLGVDLGVLFKMNALISPSCKLSSFPSIQSYFIHGF